MADLVRKVKYSYVTIPNRAGQGAKVLAEVKKAGINMLGLSAFPIKGGKAQLDVVAEDMAGVQRVARKNGWRASKTKHGFMVQGKDEVGAVCRHVQKLADQGINITAVEALATGKGRYGMILWVKPKDYRRAASVLRAK